MKYAIVFPAKVEKEMEALKRSEPQRYSKLMDLINELKETPESGTGRPKPLGYNLSGWYSRRITQKHRLIYQINEAEKTVTIGAVHGHYDDK
jgi:toxin YoeB